jgi:hypothetical protein
MEVSTRNNKTSRLGLLFWKGTLHNVWYHNARNSRRIPEQLSRRILGWVRFRYPIERIDNQVDLTSYSDHQLIMVAAALGMGRCLCVVGVVGRICMHDFFR